MFILVYSCGYGCLCVYKHYDIKNKIKQLYLS